MKTTRMLVAIALVSISHVAIGDESGHGTDGPSAAPTSPDETANGESNSFWDALLETFDVSSDE